jgi:hypothetical protein
MFTVMSGPYGSVIRRDNADGSSTWIPEWTDNADYQDYLAWLAEGNEPIVVES